MWHSVGFVFDLLLTNNIVIKLMPKIIELENYKILELHQLVLILLGHLVIFIFDRYGNWVPEFTYFIGDYVDIHLFFKNEILLLPSFAMLDG